MKKYQDDRHKRKRVKIIGGIFTTIAAASLITILFIITIWNSKGSENINQPETLQQGKISGQERKADKEDKTIEDDSNAVKDNTGENDENTNNYTVPEAVDTKSTEPLNNADNSTKGTTAGKSPSEAEKKSNKTVISEHEDTIGNNINAGDNTTIINWSFDNSEAPTHKPVQMKDPRCNLDVTSEFYKYELAYRTKDSSALEGDELIFYNNLKQALDNAYKYTEPWYQEKEIHDWIVLNATYDWENYKNGTIPQISYTAYGIFVNKVAVCDGYSRAFKLCMDILGIDNERIVGMACGVGGIEGHAWNMVKLDGEWYQIDCTFDDPVPDTGKVCYDHFNITDTMMQRNHTYEVTIPANGRKYSYYNYFYEGTVVRSLDEYYDELCRAINNNEKVLNIIHYDEESNTRMDYNSEGIEYQDYIKVYNRTGRFIQSNIYMKRTGYNYRDLELELYEDTLCTEVAVGKEGYEKRLYEHIAAGDKHIQMYILDEDYWEGKYSAEENKLIGEKAYIIEGYFSSGQHWYTSRTDWNIVYKISMDLEYLESRDNCYYVSTMEEAKNVIKEHHGEDIRIYFETSNEEKINIQKCMEGTAMGIWHEIMGIRKRILGKYTLVYLSGSWDSLQIN